MKKASSESWRIFALEVDSGVEQVATLLEKLYGVEVKRVWPKARLSVDKDELLGDLKRAGVPENYSENGRTLFILGSGEYHHLTHALARLSGKKGYAAFDWDAHTDDYARDLNGARMSPKKSITCGDFAELLTEDCGAASLNYIGTKDEPNYRKSARWATQRDIERKGIVEATRELVARAGETDCYSTVDLDVLDSDGENVRVNSKWERSGSMKLGDLLDSIRLVMQNKEVFAADITGYGAHESHAGDTSYARREKLVTVKSCLAACVVAGEFMGMDTKRARGVMEKIDWKIRLVGYVDLKPEFRDRDVLDILEKNSDGAPKDYEELLGMNWHGHTYEGFD